MIDSGDSGELPAYRPRMPSQPDVRLDTLFPDSAAPRDLYAAARAQASYLWTTASAQQELAKEMRALRKEIGRAVVTVADVAKKKAEDDAVRKHWSAIYAISMPLLAVAAGLFGAWFFK